MPEYKTKPENQLWICHLLTKSGLASGSGEAKRLVQGNAVEIDNKKVTDANLKLDLKSGQSFILKAGKKKFAKVVVE